MVFFTCNGCGESLKKNQVEKHYMYKCRNCTVLSCVDCQKDFPGDSYKEHIKCISEEEKYSGKDWKPKANANKGEQKQEAWTEKVSAAIEKCVAKPQLKALLLQIKDYPNIPRKKAKFENFLKNSLRTRNNFLISQAWDIITMEANQTKAENSLNSGQSKLETKIKNGLGATSEKRQHDEEKDIQNGNLEKGHVRDSPRKKRKQDETSEVGKEDSIEEDFSWKKHIVKLLNEAPDNELPIRKVRKKLLKKLKAYEKLNADFTEEDFTQKFDKYINRKSKFTIDDGRIRLQV